MQGTVRVFDGAGGQQLRQTHVEVESVLRFRGLLPGEYVLEFEDGTPDCQITVPAGYEEVVIREGDLRPLESGVRASGSEPVSAPAAGETNPVPAPEQAGSPAQPVAPAVEQPVDASGQVVSEGAASGQTTTPQGPGASEVAGVPTETRASAEGAGAPPSLPADQASAAAPAEPVAPADAAAPEAEQQEPVAEPAQDEPAF